MYLKSDEIMDKLFKQQHSEVKIFRTLYKESNATGHHNSEARMFSGIQNKDVWDAKDRRENFIFLTSKIFQIFMSCEICLSMSTVFIKAIDHYIKKLPDYLDNE